jgi:aminomethyltransferase
VPAHYGDPQAEALAPRLTAAMIDISAQQDLRIEGSGAAALLSAACGVSLRGLGIGHSQSVHWCADGGGLRGLGVVSRAGEEDFLLRSADADIGWFAAATPRFQASLRDATFERGLLLLAGPFAVAVLVAAGLEVSHLEPKRHVSLDWRGIAVTIFHDAELGGYEISCAADDATLVFDRLPRGGRLVGLRLAGEEAFRLLQLEAGLPIPDADFAPARENFARAPSPAALGVKEGSEAGASRVLAGIELEGDAPMVFMPVYSGKMKVGSTLRSSYSPSLKSAIALAVLSPAHAAPGTRLTVRRVGTAASRGIGGRVVSLPFL